MGTDPVTVTVDAAVDRGVTIHELGEPAVRAELLSAAEVGILSESQWSMVRERLGRAAARESGGSKVCELCGAPVMWVGTNHGSRMPIDPLPTVKGNVLVSQDDRSRRRWAKVLTKDELAEGGWPRYRSHFATCPRSAEVTRRPPSTRAKRARRSSSPAKVVAVEVTMPAGAATEAVVSRLREVLEAHPGLVPVRLVLRQDDREVALACAVSVEPGDPLAADVKVLLGERSLRYVREESVR